MNKEEILSKIREFADEDIRYYEYRGWWDKNHQYVHFLSAEDARNEIYPLLDLISDEDLRPRPYEYREIVDQGKPVTLPNVEFVFETEIEYNSDGPYADIIIKYVAPENDSLIINRVWRDVIKRARENYDAKRTAI